MDVFLLCMASLLAGFVDAVAGGGGVITFPALLFFGLPVSQIVGTSKLVSTAGTSAAAFTFVRKGLVQKEVIHVALPFTFCGALLGAGAVLAMPNGFLKPVASVVVVVVALYCFFRPSFGEHHTYEVLTPGIRRRIRIWTASLGFYDGFIGPGTGIFLSLFFIRGLGCDFLRATANTKILNWMSNAVPLVYFLTRGNVRFDLGFPMLLANLAGGYLGAHTAITKGSRFIQWIYLLMAFLTGVKLVSDLLR